jgi:hypothetical protein
MAQPIDFGQRSNEELARLLYQNSASPAKPAAPGSRQPLPEPLASRRISELEPQMWPAGERKLELEPLTDREERALFVALSKGTRASLGREPTVPELVALVERVNAARAFVTAVEQAMQRGEPIYLDDGRIVFSRSPRRPPLPHKSAEAA